MANVAEIIIQGTDRTGPAMNSAIANTKKVSAEMKGLGAAMGGVGSIASQLGNTHLATMVGGLQSSIIAATSLTKEFGKTTAGMLALGVVAGDAALSLGVALGGLLEERSLKASKERLKLAELTSESVDKQLEIQNREHAAFVRTNQQIQRRKELILNLDSIPIWERTAAVDTLEREREMRRVEYVRTANDEIARLRAEADKSFEAAQKALAAQEQKERDDNFQRYIADLDREIEEARRANEELAEEVNREADEAERWWEEKNSGFIQMQKTREDLWRNSLGNMKQAAMEFSATAAVAISDGIGNSLAAIATGAMTAKEAFKSLGKELLGMLVKWATQLVVNTVLAQTLQSSFAVTSAVIGQAVASAWAPAAALVSLASYGANAIPAAAGIIATTTLAKGIAVVGQAHAGMDYVQREGSYNLDQGEMVLDPGTSDQVRDQILGGGNQTISIYLDGEKLFEAINRGSRNGRLNISAKAIT